LLAKSGLEGSILVHATNLIELSPRSPVRQT
jgi:hypothetical protein